MSVGASRAANVSRAAGADADWKTSANWLTNDVVPEVRLLIVVAM